MEFRFKTSEESIAEALFFRLYNSYLLRDPDFKMNYDLLLDHYNTYPQSFKILTKYDLDKLKKMQDDIKIGRYSLFSGTLDFSDSMKIKAEKSDKNHQEICDLIVQNGDRIFSKITKNKIQRYSLEHPCLYGPIDILLSDCEGIDYIIEVKTSDAKHDIIGQVCKYFVGHSLKLNLRIFYDVRMITICPGYNKEAYNGLIQIGARPLILNPSSMHVTEN